MILNTAMRKTGVTQETVWTMHLQTLRWIGKAAKNSVLRAIMLQTTSPISQVIINVGAGWRGDHLSGGQMEGMNQLALYLESWVTSVKVWLGLITRYWFHITYSGNIGQVMSQTKSHTLRKLGRTMERQQCRLVLTSTFWTRITQKEHLTGHLLWFVSLKDNLLISNITAKLV